MPERDEVDLKDKHLIYNNGLLKLTALDDGTLVEIVRRVSLEDRQKLERDDASILKALKQADRQGRPLYAYFLARALAAGAYAPNWGQKDLLGWALGNELKARWRAAFAGSAGDDASLPQYGDRHVSMLLALLATMVEAIDTQTLRETFIEPRLGSLRYSQAMRRAQVIAANPEDGDNGATVSVVRGPRLRPRRGSRA